MAELTLEEVANMQGNFTSATQTDEPVAISTPTNNIVNGNPQLTNTNEPKDYKVEFILPVTEATPADAEFLYNNTAYRQIVTVKQKFISSMIARRARHYSAYIASVFTDFKELGDSKIYTPDEVVRVYENFTEEAQKACENLVKIVLGIPDHLMPYITDLSIINLSGEIIKNNKAFFQID